MLQQYYSSTAAVLQQYYSSTTAVLQHSYSSTPAVLQQYSVAILGSSRVTFPCAVRRAMAVR
eukprot:4073669-Lingulodinium_polyedra.AAC.1